MDVGQKIKEMESVDTIGEDAKSAFYKSDWFTVFMLVVFSPVGIFLMWKFKKFSQLGRLLVTTFLLGVFLMVGSYIFFMWMFFSAMHIEY